jgi:hypothetical protein
MKLTFITAIIASLCVGAAAGAGVTGYLVEKPACSTHDTSWQKFINSPPQQDSGTTYK